MNEEHYLASLKCLNTQSYEEFYTNSLPAQGKMGYQLILFKMLTKDYNAFMVIYALIIIIWANIIDLLIPGKRVFSKTISDKLPVKNWYACNTKNCSVVAVIKAVQARYKNNIFKEVTNDFSGSYKIKLKDNTQLLITNDELEIIKKEADFSGADNKSKLYAYLAFASIAKNAVLRGDFSSFKSAINYFNSGAFPEYCSELLGYLPSTMNTDPMRGLNDIIIAYNKQYALCINHGYIEGLCDRILFAGHDTMGKILDKAIIIV